MATTDFQHLSKADLYRQRQGLLGTATPPATGTTTAPTTSGTATTTQPTTTTSPSGATTQAGATTRPTRPGTGASGQATGQTAGGTGAADAGAITVSPEMWNVDANQLTSENLNKLLSEGSSYLDLARTGAAQTANARGLLNSSMAAGAGEAAAIGAALPIAQSDASVYADAAKTNTGAKNTANMFNAGEKNKFGLQAAQNAFAAAQANLDRAQQIALADKSIAAQMALQKAQQDFAGAQNALDRAQQTALQDSRISAEMAMQGKSLSSAEKIAAGNNATTLAASAANNASSEKIAAGNNATSLAATALSNEGALERTKYTTDASTATAAAELAARMKMNGDNNAAAFERTMASIDAGYKTTYLSTISTYNTGYTNYVNQVNAMDIPTDAKTSLINAATAVYDDNVAITNAMFTDLPNLFGVTTAP